MEEKKEKQTLPPYSQLYPRAISRIANTYTDEDDDESLLSTTEQLDKIFHYLYEYSFDENIDNLALAAKNIFDLMLLVDAIGDIEKEEESCDNILDFENENSVDGLVSHDLEYEDSFEDDESEGKTTNIIKPIAHKCCGKCKNKKEIE